MTDSHIGHLSDDELVLLHYREADGVDRREAERHLSVCTRCREAQERLASVMAIVSEHLDQAEPAPEGFERVMWARVQGRLETTSGPDWRMWARFSRFAVPLGVTALLAVAFVAGRWSNAPVSVTPAVERAAAGVPGDGVLLVAVGDHLERSQIVIAELLRADTDTPVSAAERERASDLVSAGRLIRQSAAEAGEPGLAGVLEEVERVLLEVANGDADAGEALQQLKARIEGRGILFRVRVMGAELRERADERGRRAPPVS